MKTFFAVAVIGALMACGGTSDKAAGSSQTGVGGAFTVTSGGAGNLKTGASLEIDPGADNGTSVLGQVLSASGATMDTFYGPQNPCPSFSAKLADGTPISGSTCDGHTLNGTVTTAKTPFTATRR